MHIVWRKSERLIPTYLLTPNHLIMLFLITAPSRVSQVLTIIRQKSKK